MDKTTSEQPVATKVDSKEDQCEILNLTDPAARMYEHMPLLDMYCANLANKVTTVLEDYIRFPLKIDAEKPKVRKFDPIHRSDDQPLLDRLFRLQGIGSLAAFSIPSDLTFRLVDILFGGLGDVESAETDREISPTESNMLDVVSNTMLQALSELLAATPMVVDDLNIVPWSYQQAAQEGSIESMVAIPFSISLGDSSGVVEFWISLSVVELLLGVKLRPSQDGKIGDPAWSKIFKDQVFDCQLDLNCTLAELSVPLSHVSRLVPGDFIPITDINEATFSIETLPLFKAKVGIANQHASASFIQWI